MERFKVQNKTRSRVEVHVGGFVYLCDYQSEVDKVINQFGKEKCKVIRKESGKYENN